MARDFLKFIDNPKVIKIRCAAIVVVVAVAVGSVLLGAEAQISEMKVIEEHRFTVIESDVQVLKDELKELKFYHWITLILTSCVAGETGIRVIRRKV